MLNEGAAMTGLSGYSAASELGRRHVLGTMMLAAGSAPRMPTAAASEARPSPQNPGPSSFFVYVGCRTTRERNARGDGINVYRMDAASGSWEHVQLVPG